MAIETKGLAPPPALPGAVTVTSRSTIVGRALPVPWSTEPGQLFLQFPPAPAFAAIRPRLEAAMDSRAVLQACIRHGEEDGRWYRKGAKGIVRADSPGWQPRNHRRR